MMIPSEIPAAISTYSMEMAPDSTSCRSRSPRDCFRMIAKDIGHECAPRYAMPTVSRTSLPTSPQTPREPGGALVDAAPSAYELTQRLGIRLVHRRVSHGAAPLAPRSLVGLGRVRGAPNNRCERVFPVRHFQPLYAQRPARSFDLAAFGCPPGHEGRIGALLVDSDPMFYGERNRFVTLATQYAVPTVYPTREYVEGGVRIGTETAAG
jgi:hypothetical protein